MLLDAFAPIEYNERQLSASAATGNCNHFGNHELFAGLTGLSPVSLKNSENLSASEWNNNNSNSKHDNLAADGSKLVIDTVASVNNATRVARMEYLHQVCRLLLLLIKNRAGLIKVREPFFYSIEITRHHIFLFFSV